MKIAVSNYHARAFDMVCDLLPEDIERYEFEMTEYDYDNMRSCDLLFCPLTMCDDFADTNLPKILFIPHRHRKSYFRKISTNKKYRVRGFMCYSESAADAAGITGLPVFRYHKRYWIEDGGDVGPPQSQKIVSLINNYERYSRGERKYWTSWERMVRQLEPSSFDAFLQIKNALPESDIQAYGWDKELGEEFVDAYECLEKARYLLHVKYWGHVCNATVQALAMGVPLLMDRFTYEQGWYRGYVKHGHNAYIGKNIKDLISFIRTDDDNVYGRLRENTIKEAKKFHLPYPDEDKARMRNFLNNILD